MKRVKVLAISNYVKKILRRYGIKSVVDYDQCRVDLSFINKAKKVKKYSNKKVVLFVGRLSKEKGLE